jgi:3-oxoadipate enol-lactonase
MIERRSLLRGLVVAAMLASGCAQVPAPGGAVPAPIAAAPAGQFVDVNGARLYYETAGPASAETIVLVHQFTLDARMWDDQMSEFARRYRVIRYDARGFGRSSPIRGAYLPRDDLRGLLDALKVTRVHVVGVAMGARYAIDFALAYPDRVRTLVVADPSVSGLGFTGPFVSEYAQAAAAARAGNIGDAKQRWLSSSLFGATREKPDVMKRVQEMVASYDGWLFANTDPAIATQPAAAQLLGRIKAPVLVVLGERSLRDIHAMGERVYRDAPLARRVVLKETGHLANMESPAAFNRAVLEFLASPPTTALPASDKQPATAPCVDRETKRATKC